MLVLSFKTGEAMMIQHEGVLIEARVLEIKGHQVKIGTNAPPEVTIDREVIYKKRISGEWK